MKINYIILEHNKDGRFEAAVRRKGGSFRFYYPTNASIDRIAALEHGRNGDEISISLCTWGTGKLNIHLERKVPDEQS